MDWFKKIIAWFKEFDDEFYEYFNFHYHTLFLFLFTVFFLFVLLILAQTELSYAAVTQLPGEDASDKLEAAGTLLRVLDTGLFKWGARVFAGISIMSSAWALKEQRFGIAIICVVGAILFGTAPKWVKNIFEVGDNQSLFSLYEASPQPVLPVLEAHQNA